MSRYKAYPEYKDSGEEWLGFVPSHWDVAQIKHLSPVKRGASPRPIDDEKYFDENGEYAWTRIADVTASDVYLTEAPQRLSALGSSLSVKLDRGALFLSIAGTVGKPCITGIKACIHDGFVYFPELKIPAKFLFYVFAGEQAYKGLGKFGTQLNLNTDTVGAIKIGCPGGLELEKVVAFLDHETAKIDALIEKQQQLIELLKEKRQAVISHAVTKGLNPKAPMKDSGVEWLGEVPAHWEIKKLKYLCGLQTGNKNTEDAIDDGTYPFFVRSQTVERLNSFTADCEAVLTAGDGAGVGKVFHYFEGKFDFHQRVYMMNNFQSVSGKFFFHYLAIMFHMVALDGGAKSTVDSLRMPLFMNFQITTPPRDEQRAIVSFIESNNKKFDDLSKRAVDAVELLQERRTALISAAVTGKIDVRDWQPAAA